MKPTVILTRSESDVASLYAALHTGGYQVRHLPLLSIEPLPNAQLQPLTLQADDRVIFVSANAVRHGMPRLRFTDETRGDVFAVGRRTGEALASVGLAAVVPEREDSEGLLALPGLQAVTGARVVIVKGEGGRELIAETLVDRGATVVAFSCYRRVYHPLPSTGNIAELLSARPLVWVAGSGGMATHLGQELAKSGYPELQAETLVVPSRRAAVVAARDGWQNVLTSADAGDAAVLAVLQRHFP